ncbi:unannotated protein [freshwater metagenome]|uniref:Unannotated protein n=1 Tax=freshwater metagenome TaxID=449393 RepID=A0A6J7MJZ8_9ZZZZ
MTGCVRRQDANPNIGVGLEGLKVGSHRVSDVSVHRIAGLGTVECEYCDMSVDFIFDHAGTLANSLIALCFVT